MNFNGLSDKEVVESRKKYGSNYVENNKSNSFISLLLESLGDPIIKILLVAFGIKVIFLFKDFDWFETLGIFIAIFLASFISSISEYGSEKAFKKLQEQSLNINVKVKRNGTLLFISIKDIVVGDIVYLESGDKVPSDGIILTNGVSVDESALNGESLEVYKNINDEVYKGSIVTDGSCYIKTIRVGMNTIYGNIENELSNKTIDSPLKSKLRDLAKTISKIGYLGSFLVVISYLFSVIVIKNNYNIDLIMNTLTNSKLMIDYLIYSLTLCVTIIIVAVPEGLPMMVALVLSSNVKRMLKSNVLVRKMVGIETAGSLNILFTDKTGTITSGEVCVEKLINYKGNVVNNKSYIDIFNSAILYNNLSEYNNGNIIGGNSTDKALIKYLKLNKNMDYEHVLLFNSKNKYSITKLVKDNIYYYKGANEVILDMCSFYLDELGYKQLIRDRDSIKKIVNNYTNLGFRVLSVAYGNNDKLKDLCFVGFVILKDIIRDNAKLGINRVNDSHIQIVMITGDDKNTALKIAKEIDLVKKNSDIILTHDELSKMSDDAVISILPNLRVIARSLPSDKSRMVRICQKNNLVVGMTGDGVNDAPALKLADVGFSIGSGTEVAKESSDIVILDNNLISISNAVLFGRTIFKSIRKFIIYQLTVNFCAMILSIVGPFIGVTTPITVIQMLWINMIMDTLAGLAFSYEFPNLEYSYEYPKKRSDKIINKYMLSEIICSGLYSSILLILFLKCKLIKLFFINTKSLMTGFFALFIFMGIFNAFNARTTKVNIFSDIKNNKVFIIMFVLISLVQIYLIYFGGSLFRTYGLSLYEFIFIIVLSLSVILVDIIRKFLCKKNINGYI